MLNFYQQLPDKVLLLLVLEHADRLLDVLGCDAFVLTHQLHLGEGHLQRTDTERVNVNGGGDVPGFGVCETTTMTTLLGSRNSYIRFNPGGVCKLSTQGVSANFQPRGCLQTSNPGGVCKLSTQGVSANFQPRGCLQIFLPEDHLSYFTTVRSADILRSVTVSWYFTFCKINK